VTFRDTIDLAIRNLGQAKLRTALTTLGVSIGIASLSGMVSLGVGLQDQFVDRFARSGVFDSVNVLAGSAQVSLGRGRGRGPVPFGQRETRPVESGPAKEITDESLQEIAALPQVRDVYPSLRVPLQVKHGDRSEFTTASGVPMSSRNEGVFQSIPHGRFFAADTEAGCMLSLDYARRMNDKDPGSLVGQTLTLIYPAAVAAPSPTTPPPPAQPTETTCTIVGVVERETGPFAAAGGPVSGVMIPLGKAKEIWSARGLRRTYPAATVKVRSAQATQDVQEQIRRLGFSAFSIADALQGAKRAFLILDIVLALIGSIALAVSSLGIMNTMVMSILERTREIGIMKAIGGSDGDIRRIFLIEASAIGCLGGLAGVVLGWIVGRAINFAANVYIQQQGGTTGNLFSLPFWLIAAAIGFSIAVSLMAGSYPAARAARLNPIAALRHD
jgi:ABC-type antimicrobial peptide transport system permease subunit